jgi:hypothetical protein
MRSNSLTGTVVRSTICSFPLVEWLRGKDTVRSLVLVDQMDRAKGLVGKQVEFIILSHPYGSDIASDNGFAKLIEV